jgi:pimeloyl-ACP methyl ester carboxylesterase
MKKTASLLLILLLILLAACQDAAPEATAVPEPTVAVEDTPSEEAPPEEPEEAADATEAPEPAAAPTETPTEETAPEPTAEAEPAEEASEEKPMEEAAETGDPTTNLPAEQLEMMAAIAPPPQLSERELGIYPVPCSPGVLSGNNLVEGEDYTCGVFTVPQNWEEPDGRNLDLSFVVVQATGENPEPDPLLFLEGGPGVSAILGKDIEKYQKLRPDRDLIFFDIRGLGLSQRLGFEECLVLALQNGAPAEQIAALQVAAPNLLTKVRGETPVDQPTPEELDFPVLNEICWEQFTAQGLDLNQFSTASNAQDAVELIKALGYESFNIDSVSYGTRLAMTIMNNIPSFDGAPQLRSVVLDSAFPPSVYLIRTIVRSDHDFLPQLLDECQADATCNEAYPNLSERLAALLNQLEEAPLMTSGETVTLDDLVKQLKPGGTRAAYVPKMIAELEMGVLDTYLALRDGEVGADPPEAIPMSAPAVTEELDPSDPVQAFVAAALDLLSPTEALFFPEYLKFLVVEEDPLAVLPEFIAETYTDETADQLLALSGTLTPEDFANSPYVAELQAEMAAASDPEAQLVSMRESNAKGNAQLLYSSIHCIDDILNESFEDAVNSYNSLAFPQLTNLDKSQAFANRCQNWLVDPAPIEVKGPVSSSVPALILQGAYDKPTPIYMGQTANSELANSTYVLIPQQDHWTWRNAESCVGQIATAYLLDPETELDLSCLDARQPQWVLPGDDGS